jgi:lipopolysaccharide transport system ATP-binding protein
MSSDVAMWAEGLGKRYRIGAGRRADTLRDAIASRFVDWSAAWRRRSMSGALTAPRTAAEIWALRDASFQVKHGEMLGVVGRNGAGKSTLLKILSRITEPTEGRAGIHGRVASLLEVGTGFHQELSGRENIYVNGSILGMKRAEIRRRFDEIVAFAEVEPFIDTPVKHYSSGMQVRLAFAVAAHLEPEILLVDEVLAVGDAGFQKKCLGKMKEVGHSGRTILFVSHNLAAVASLCRRAILIDQGRITRDGPTGDVVQEYLGAFAEIAGASIGERADRFHGDRFRITSVVLADARGQHVPALRSGDAGQIIMRYRCLTDQPLKGVLVNLYLHTPWGERICDFRTDFVGDNFEEIPREGEFVCTVPRMPLQPGRYPFTFRVYSSEQIGLDEVQNAGEIRIDPGDFHGFGRVPAEQGILYVDHTWRCRSAVAELTTAELG